MVLDLKKFPSRRGVPEWRGVLAALLAALLAAGCVDAERNNPYDENGNNFKPGLLGWVSSSSVPVYSPSSNSVEPGYSSSVPSSSSQEPSSVSQVPSSSSPAPSSSSPEPSSVSQVPSSSSPAPSSSSPAPSSSSPAPSSSSPAPSSSSLAPSTNVLEDSRDSKTYRAVVIGTQTWMAENLNYNATGSLCYSNQDSNCDKYGRLYNWATAMNNAPSSTAVPSGVRGVCPEGWHLPSRAEWEVMTAYIGGESTEGKKLKATSGWNSSGNGTDEYGFSALPGGYGFSDGSFNYVGNSGGWWSASENNSDYAYRRYMGYYDEGTVWSSNGKSNLFSVRCLQD